jgi:hypothetical protein
MFSMFKYVDDGWITYELQSLRIRDEEPISTYLEGYYSGIIYLNYYMCKDSTCQ